MNICMFRGYCCRDAMMFQASNGGKIAKFSLGVKNYGNKDENDVFPKFTCFGKLAEKAEKIAVKGNLLFVEGRFTESTYQNKKGETIYDKSFIVTQLTLCNGTYAEDETQSYGFDILMQQAKPTQQYEQQQFNPYTGDAPSLDIASDDLPF